jgi:hypothetical protein
VVWRRNHGPDDADLVVTTVTANGQIGGTALVVPKWKTLTDATIVTTPSGLQVLFSGMRDPATLSDPYNVSTLFTATAPASGDKWTLAPAPVRPDPAAPQWPDGAGDGYDAYGPVAGTVEKDGTPVGAWNLVGNADLVYQRGLDPAAAKLVPATAGEDVGWSSLATDQGSGEVYASWWEKKPHVRRILPSLGADRVLGSERNREQPARVVSRAGGGVCEVFGVGKPDWTGLNIWCSHTGRTVHVWTGDVGYYSTARAWTAGCGRCGRRAATLSTQPSRMQT